MADQLVTWDELQQQEWPNLLLGNGFSINTHPEFSYASLLTESDLPDKAKALFEAVGTTDFETVMRVLATARVAASALSYEVEGFQRVYDAFRDALIQAVRKVHVEHSRVPPGLLPYVGQHLAEFDRIFTTNYDLLPYWATMDAGDVGHARFYDSFGPEASGGLVWQRSFHDNDAKPSIYYLHGALHLVADIYSGRVRKVRAGGGALLESVIQTWSGGDVTALFVSEGDSQQKRAAIDASAYLRACYDRLRIAAGGIVVLGHGLSNADHHIVVALREGNRPLAIGLHGGDEQISAHIEHLEEQFMGMKVYYFRSQEHPLTIPALGTRPQNGIWFPPKGGTSTPIS